jgi:hypothetical protein
VEGKIQAIRSVWGRNVVLGLGRVPGFDDKMDCAPSERRLIVKQEERLDE